MAALALSHRLRSETLAVGVTGSAHPTSTTGPRGRRKPRSALLDCSRPGQLASPPLLLRPLRPAPERPHPQSGRPTHAPPARPPCLIWWADLAHRLRRDSVWATASAAPASVESLASRSPPPARTSDPHSLAGGAPARDARRPSRPAAAVVVLVAAVLPPAAAVPTTGLRWRLRRCFGQARVSAASRCASGQRTAHGLLRRRPP
mmetsp:Transcript_10215/g.33672  ORF Transcript_10215/g.33672 Transcript_10215/m.33672 type:complete len:204 (+) Transcript_10215:179-790(+)